MANRQTLFAFLFAVCFVQGAFLAPIVVSLRNVNRRAVRILALLILCFLPMIGEELISAAGLARRFPHTIASSITVDFLIAPLLFFYARSLTDPDRPFARRDWLHFIPFVAASLVLLPFMTLSGAEKLELRRLGLPWTFTVVISPKVVVAAIYLTVIIRRLRRFVDRKDDVRASDPHVVWLLRMMIALAVVAVASVGLGLLAKAGVRLPVDSDTVGILFICGCLYLVSALLIRYPLASMASQGKRLTELIVPAPFRRKYETSPLGEVQKQGCLDRLVQHMDAQKPHLDMSLNLEKLAEAIGMRAGHLSQVLNECLEMNFYEFVNEYRVREARARIADPRRSDKTLMAIAHESGFNSKASFNRAFKRVTGQTPSEYARTHVVGPAPVATSLTLSSEATGIPPR